MKEQELVKRIKKIINDGGIVTINLKENGYVPAPVYTPEECVNFINYDGDIQEEKLIKELKEQNEIKCCFIRKNIILVVKRGTNIAVYQ